MTTTNLAQHASAHPSDQVRSYRIWQVITASAVGTMIEWYDFYIFGSLAVTISPLFYPEGNDTLALIAYLSTFAVGFVVRPFGALFFGRIGDLVGRKYALFYLQTILKVNSRSANYIVAIALLLGMPLFVFFGALSDRIGRKRIMMAGCLIAAVSYIPIYQTMQKVAGSQVVTAVSQRNETTGAISLTPQTVVDGELQPAKEVLPYSNFESFIVDPIAWQLILLVFIQVIFVTMVYGPIAAYLVEAFPAKIRYTALSLPYHIGNGVFGGLLPLIGLSVIAQTGNIYAGLYYPIIVASLTFIVGSLLLKETRHTLIWDEVK